MTKELAIKTTYAVTRLTQKDLAGVIMEAAGENGLTPSDLDRVKIPSGGGVAWEIPSLEGPKTEKEIVGVILHHHDARAYWQQSMEEAGGNQPPDCSSSDGAKGLGLPGGDCASCPLAAFGSGKKGRGQACKAVKLLYILMPDDILPVVAVMAPTSIKPIRQYLIRLASRGLRASQVVTAIGLEKQKNTDGISYAKAVPAMREALDPETAAKIAAFAETFRASMGRVTLHSDDVSSGE